MDTKQMFDFWLAPWRASLALTSASLDTMLTMQKSMMSLSSITLDDGFDGADENLMRQAFQLTADANVRRWADTAGVLQAMPDWYHQVANGPGAALTDMFDKARRSVS
ncbi:hypothetical protein HNE_2993 [Hyphomonas neptunium ATCC 15444]|uniref:Phasin domain-containing protein n=2 Tax=Hyphomonas TaxID=85 RepID=Q0BXX3_HYPNA|nr:MULTISPECIES: hypothetical protein [Hyphomonas]ABI77073.1 hypothetical protein HNE_2993 [Hyphomonas neptunium ATCC 15444]KCZ93639.1 hypothetical protein HHI_09592 [Hyphomonas hirschiana VP5]